MKIRENHPILDRIKVIAILLFLAWILGRLVELGEGNKYQSTLEDFLQKAMEPVGTTMYIWGGGWDEADSTSGIGSTRIGVSPMWKDFADTQDSTYDFTEYRYEREKGLDCSGYVGWVVYNVFEDVDGQNGYVAKSTVMAKEYAERGWGRLLENPKEYLPGDIVSMEGHVWICLGTCTDGSVLLVHSSPPGVSVCGTEARNVGADAQEESIAVQLATEFMTNYFSGWQERYPNRVVGNHYLENTTVMRWNRETMRDAADIQNRSGEEIIKFLMNQMFE